jgi:hypothetical protein
MGTRNGSKSAAGLRSAWSAANIPTPVISGDGTHTDRLKPVDLATVLGPLLGLDRQKADEN